MKRTQHRALLLGSVSFLSLCAVQATPRKVQPTKQQAKRVETLKRGGKLGEVLSDGNWKFQVLALDALDSFKLKNKADIPNSLAGAAEWNAADRVLTAKPGYRLIVLLCRVTNNQNTGRRLWTSPSDEKLRTALIDTAGESHRPIAFDYPGAPVQTPPFPPRTMQTFPVVFGVKQEVKPRELVFTLKHNDYFVKGNDVRVTLAWAKKPLAATASNNTSTQKIPITPATATETPTDESQTEIAEPGDVKNTSR
jgi:hypothetical protein